MENDKQIEAKVSECGGKAKPINEQYPELPLTTPMPPNSIIMVESETVSIYQWPNGKWQQCTDNDSRHAIAKGYPVALGYKPIKSDQIPPSGKMVPDQQSEGEKEKATVPSGQQLQVMSMSRNGVWDWFSIDEDLQDGALQECITKRMPYRLIPIPAKSASGETVEHINNNELVNLEESPTWKLYRLIEDKHFMQSDKDHLSVKQRNKFEEEYWIACEAASEIKQIYTTKNQQSKSLQGVVDSLNQMECPNGVDKAQFTVVMHLVLTKIKTA